MKPKHILNILLAIILLCLPLVYGKSYFIKEKIHRYLISDSIPTDSIKTGDSLKTAEVNADTLKISSKALDAEVKYQAEDSIIFLVDSQLVFLYGKADVTYEKMNIKAGEIILDQKTNLVRAQGSKDSVGNFMDNPDFSDGTQNFKSKSMVYNTKTKKGKIKEVTTVEGESYLRGEVVKKDSTNVVYMQHGQYTTCNLDHPHYFFALSKLKVIPDDKIITGPANLVVGDIPTPLALPFGFFPNKKGRANGILIPTYGQALNYGFFFKDGGYYMGLGEKADLTVRADIYTRGSWALRTISSYNNIYKYSGNLSLSYSVFKIGEEGFPNFEKKKDFFVTWKHAQDAKSNPGSRFTADVNFGTSTFNKLNSYNTNNILSNTFQSSIQYAKVWNKSSLTVSARQSQNTSSRRFDITAPELTYAVNRFYPFKRKNPVGANKWYEDIGLTYTNSTRAQLSTIDTLLYAGKVNWNKDVSKGMNHIIPLNTSIKLLKYFTLSPNVTYTESWYLQSINKTYDSELQKVKTDTIRNFSQARDLSFNASFRTIIYGMYQFKGGAIKALRHVLTPSFGYTYNPGLSGYKTVQTNADGKQERYSRFQGAMYGSPTQVKSQTLNMGLVNNLEMKVRNKKDTLSGFTKIKIFENLSFNSSYDLIADSFNLSPITINARTSPINNLSFNFDATANPYAIDPITNQIINSYEVNKTGSLARMTRMSVNVAFNFASKKGKPVSESSKATKEELDEINRYRYQYVDFNIPWTFNCSYQYTYTRPNTEVKIIQTLSFNGDINVTEKWKVGFNSGFDIMEKKFTQTTLNIYRDLHCWEIRLNMIPFGFRKSYSIDINVKSSILQDLKLTRKRDWYDLQ